MNFYVAAPQQAPELSRKKRFRDALLATPTYNESNMAFGRSATPSLDNLRKFAARYDCSVRARVSTTQRSEKMRVARGRSLGPP